MSLKKWFDNARSVSLVQSVMPSVLAVVLAIGKEGFHWWDAVLAVVGVACAHLAMNLTDDYFDYKVDMLGDRDKVTRQGFRAMLVKYPYLTDGSQTLKSTAVAIASFIIAAMCCGGVILLDRWGTPVFAPVGLWWIGAIVACCAFLGVFYSAPPFKLAYRGLGEPVIGIIFGPLLMMGVYYASCAQMSPEVVLTSVPVGLLVMNILFTHSFVEMAGDAQSNKMTLARLIGSTKGNLTASAIINFLPFVMIVLGVCLGDLSAWYLCTLLVLPRGIWLFRSLVQYSKGAMMEIERPPFWLGPMPNWDKYRSAKIDWFMGRWLCARNLLSGFCCIIMIVTILLRVI